MIARAVTEARHELLIRELQRAALRDMCLRALTAGSGQGAIEVREICPQAPAGTSRDPR